LNTILIRILKRGQNCVKKKGKWRKHRKEKIRKKQLGKSNKFEKGDHRKQ
jgi:hypothetical protein